MHDTTTGERLIMLGISIGHSCDDCFKLTVMPEYLHSAGASFHSVVTFTAGHAGEPHPEVGSVSVDLDAIPWLIARLQEFCDQQLQAGDSFVPGWHVDI
jgi:hypothetical protein